MNFTWTWIHYPITYISKSVSFETSVPIFIQIMLPFKYPADDDPKVQARGRLGGKFISNILKKNLFLHFWKWPSSDRAPAVEQSMVEWTFQTPPNAAVLFHTIWNGFCSEKSSPSFGLNNRVSTGFKFWFLKSLKLVRIYEIVA